MCAAPPFRLAAAVFRRRLNGPFTNSILFGRFACSAHTTRASFLGRSIEPGRRALDGVETNLGQAAIHTSGLRPKDKGSSPGGLACRPIGTMGPLNRWPICWAVFVCVIYCRRPAPGPKPRSLRPDWAADTRFDRFDKVSAWVPLRLTGRPGSSRPQQAAVRRPSAPCPAPQPGAGAY